MSAAKTERLMNLLIMLLVQRHFVAKSRIREILYADASDDAFERMFDRDKEELRSIGVPIELGSIDAYFDDEPGYRIQPDEFALPEISLEPDEAAVVGLASRVWQHQRLARATTEAVRKLTASGADIDVTALEIAQPRLSADEPTFDVFFEAVIERREVRFDYWRTGQDAPSRRRLQPWGVTRYSGRWYVVGFDLDRADERIFRLSRVQGAVSKVGEPGAYEVPADLDAAAVARRLAPTPHRVRAVVLAQVGAATPLRRDAVSVETGVTGPDGSDGWDRLIIDRAGGGIADEICSFGPAVYVEAPPELRESVIERMAASVEGLAR
ncbi:YafY family protein [Nocardioides sp. R-C-SC26]|uniref:helix-turn-helix transcriptional regulator n=1 Tax=Nocardioides sp. R-C-SC26 TaxID=2870414 RepID=UPI001E2FCFF3|nr:WYL domain-containing protein [Nocardioides sp. R-C-SC26]